MYASRVLTAGTPGVPDSFAALANPDVPIIAAAKRHSVIFFMIITYKEKI